MTLPLMQAQDLLSEICLGLIDEWMVRATCIYVKAIRVAIAISSTDNDDTLLLLHGL